MAEGWDELCSIRPFPSPCALCHLSSALCPSPSALSFRTSAFRIPNSEFNLQIFTSFQ